MASKKVIKKKKTKNNQKLITFLLCISLFCVFSFLFIVILDRPYNYSTKVKQKIVSEFDNYKILDIDNDLYLKETKTDELTKINIMKTIEDDETIYLYRDNKYRYIYLFDDINDNRIWLFSNDDDSISIYDYKEDKIIDNIQLDEAKMLSLLKANNTYFYIMEASGIAYNSYYATIYNKSLTNILDEDYFLVLDGIKDNVLYLHNINYNNKNESISFFSINQNGIIKEYRTFDNNKVLGYDFENGNYVIDENHQLILKDNNDREIKVIVDVPLPYSVNDYSYVVSKVSFMINGKGEKLIKIRFSCEDGLEEGIYNYEYTYNLTNDKLYLVKR